MVQEAFKASFIALALTTAIVGNFDINGSSYNYVGYMNKSDKPIAYIYNGDFVVILSTDGIVEAYKKDGSWIQVQ